MTYKIGTRVKQVRGKNIGATGIVVSGPNSWGDYPYPDEMCVRNDAPWVTDCGLMAGAGTTSCTKPSLWEPILDRHEPCESDFKESLDKLLSEVSREAV